MVNLYNKKTMSKIICSLFFTMCLPSLRSSRAAWTTWATRAVECTETVSKREDYVTSECVVTNLLMVVGSVGYRQILRLSEDVVRFESKGELVLEKPLGHLGIKDDLILMLCRISFIPVVVNI